MSIKQKIAITVVTAFDLVGVALVLYLLLHDRLNTKYSATFSSPEWNQIEIGMNRPEVEHKIGMALGERTLDRPLRTQAWYSTNRSASDCYLSYSIIYNHDFKVESKTAIAMD